VAQSEELSSSPSTTKKLHKLSELPFFSSKIKKIIMNNRRDGDTAQIT
jgi:hypothetical protein